MYPGQRCLDVLCPQQRGKWHGHGGIGSFAFYLPGQPVTLRAKTEAAAPLDKEPSEGARALRLCIFIDWKRCTYPGSVVLVGRTVHGAIGLPPAACRMATPGSSHIAHVISLLGPVCLPCCIQHGTCSAAPLLAGPCEWTRELKPLSMWWLNSRRPRENAQALRVNVFLWRTWLLL